VTDFLIIMAVIVFVCVGGMEVANRLERPRGATRALPKK
jgi:hypothetical protein